MRSELRRLARVQAREQGSHPLHGGFGAEQGQQASRGLRRQAGYRSGGGARPQLVVAVGPRSRAVAIWRGGEQGMAERLALDLDEIWAM
jgi:hypothetical protein